jgi:hypothetical protein
MKQGFDSKALVLAGLILFLVALPVALNRPRGIRNKNPGNLRPLAGTATWKGQIALDTAKGGPFVIFGEAEGQPGEFWGIRALSRLLLNYQRNHGLFTIEGIINRYAPPVENDTGSYSKIVAKSLGVSPDQPIDLISDGQLHRNLVAAVIKHENGQNPYNAALLATAVQAGRA